jgi:hypothetical protein
MSVPNVAHLDPQRGGCCTVFPFFIGATVELPVTTTQDYSLFHVLKDYSTLLWQEQIRRIVAKHGLISFIIHPDYVIDPASRRVYVELLAHLSKLRALGKLWVALPGHIAEWWKVRSELTLVNSDGSWRIIGKGSERARVAYAVRVNDQLVYEIDTVSAATPVQIPDEGSRLAFNQPRRARREDQSVAPRRSPNSGVVAWKCRRLQGNMNSDCQFWGYK